MKVIFLVFLLSSFSSLTLTKVVNSFKKSCPDFFIKSPHNTITPTVFEKSNYMQICQSWKNTFKFATLYDTVKRIPVYSAYKFSGGEDKTRSEEWKNEPQLENSTGGQDMELISKDKMDEFFHQAVNRDYEESKENTGTEYTRGHVFPNQYAVDQDQAESTFTFTNVAPQTRHSNGEWAKKVEDPMKKLIKRECNPNNNNPTYIVTGVVPGDKWIPITRKVKNESKKIDEGVNIPSYYWTAFCCINNNVKISKGYLALQNTPNDKTYEISEMSVDRLNGHLTRLYGQDFTVFSAWCVI